MTADINYIDCTLTTIRIERPHFANEVDLALKELHDLRGEKAEQERYANEIGLVMEDMAKLMGFSDEVDDADVLRSANKMLTEYVQTYIDRNFTVWTRPTAWAYFAACRALNHNREMVNQALSMLINSPELIPQGLFDNLIKILNTPVDSSADNSWDEKVRQATIAMQEDPGTEEIINDGG